MDRSLTDAILVFKNTGKGFDDLVQQVGLVVYNYPRRRFGWTEDDCSEFFCYFYPKVAGLITRFQYTGKPFEAFLSVTLKWQLKTYATRKKLESMRDRVITSENFWGQLAGFSTEDLEERIEEDSFEDARERPALTAQARRVLRVGADGRIEDNSARRRLLFLLLKEALKVSSRLVDRVALVTGYEREWILEKIQILHARTEERRVRLGLLKDKRNDQFFRIYCLQEQLSLVCDDSARAMLMARLLREQRRLSETIQEIRRVPFAPTHRDIAEVLEIPKGSVDSGLYYLRSAFEQLYPDDEIRYA